jgi:hypothetical protein
MMEAYKSPGLNEIRKLKNDYGLSAAQIGDLVGANSRTVRKWLSPSDKPEARDMPWAAYMLLRLLIGDISLDEVKKVIEGQTQKRDEIRKKSDGEDV